MLKIHPFKIGLDDDMKKYYKRENYLKRIRGFYNDASMIKVISGVRRCGKSCLMATIAQELTESGVEDENIIFIDLDKRGFKNVKTQDQLEKVIDERATAKGLKYLFIDEVQNVDGFEEVLNAYQLEDEFSIFVTGSKRFDLKSKKSIGCAQKYYLSDLGFWFATNTDNRINYWPILENIVYCYALSKGYKISIGRIGKLECDFILRDSNMDYSYVQVSMTIMNDIKTEDREYAPFEMIHDNYPKYLLTRNDPIQKRNGIKHVNIPEFMADGKMFD